MNDAGSVFSGRKFVLVVGDTSGEARRLRREIQESGGVVAYSIGPQVCISYLLDISE